MSLGSLHFFLNSEAEFPASYVHFEDSNKIELFVCKIPLGNLRHLTFFGNSKWLLLIVLSTVPLCRNLSRTQNKKNNR